MRAEPRESVSAAGASWVFSRARERPLLQARRLVLLHSDNEAIASRHFTKVFKLLRDHKEGDLAVHSAVQSGSTGMLALILQDGW